MRALIVDPEAVGGLRLGEAPDPVPGPGQLLVEIRHTSLNSAELYFVQRGAPGDVIGFDSAGVVVRAAADGSGPSVGSRVVGYGDNGGFGALRALDVADVAVVPDEVDLGEAATLPVAAGTALRALEQAGPLLGRRVLVTGASGGVGGFAVQLAALGGAYVIGVAGSADGARWVGELGAREVVAGVDEVKEPLDVVIDTVGGPNWSPPTACWPRAAVCRASAGPPGGRPCCPWASRSAAAHPRRSCRSTTAVDSPTGRRS
ncbi:zinc-binding dehydrogenase [Streptomyces galilaeus]